MKIPKNQEQCFDKSDDYLRFAGASLRHPQSLRIPDNDEKFIFG